MNRSQPQDSTHASRPAPGAPQAPTARAAEAPAEAAPPNAPRFRDWASI
jgi:hypothetical protein